MMTGVLLFVAGVAVGALGTWLVSRRFRPAPQWQAAAALTIPDDIQLPSDTAMHVAMSVEGEVSFEPLAYVLVERCAARVEVPCLVAMREGQGARAAITTVSGVLDRRLVGQDLPLESDAGRTITDGVPVVTRPDGKMLGIASGDRRRPVTGGVAVPISQGSVVYGALVALGDPPGGSHDAIAAMSELARKYAPVLVPAHAAMVAMRRAQTDELTGLPNRRQLSASMAGPARDKAALIMLDIDHFKQVNDTHGHEAGDVALKHVARIIRDQVRWRDGDVAARIGGEEFAVWLPGADMQIAYEIAERMRAQVESSPFPYAGQRHPLTISVGVSAYPFPTPAVENLLNVADTALYTAKRGGRNKVVQGRGSMAMGQPPAAGQ
jgi:diguanylate cyclase (GGDEF)-like protein